MSYPVTPARDKEYKDAYLLIQSLAGVGTFSAAEKLDITRFVNRRLRTAYNSSSAWPRYLVPNQKRAVSSFVVNGITNGQTMPTAGPSIANGLYYLIGYLDPNLHGTYTDGSNKPVYGRTSNYVYGANDFVGNAGNYQNYVFTKNAVIGNDRWTLSEVTLSVSRYDDKGNVFLTFSTNTGSLFIQATNTPEVDNPGDTVFVAGVDAGPSASTEGQCIVEKKQCVDFYGDNWSTVGPEKTDTRVNTLRNNTNNYGVTGYDIGQFIKIHRTKPYVDNSAYEYDFYVDNDGANILNAHGVGNSVFVTYKRPLVDLRTPNTDPDEAPVNESLERIPIEFFPYVCHGAYSDFLTMDGQVSKAITENELAQNLLDRELEQIDIMYNNNRPVGKFSTYVNRQSR